MGDLNRVKKNDGLMKYEYSYSTYIKGFCALSICSGIDDARMMRYRTARLCTVRRYKFHSSASAWSPKRQPPPSQRKGQECDHPSSPGGMMTGHRQIISVSLQPGPRLTAKPAGRIVRTVPRSRRGVEFNHSCVYYSCVLLVRYFRAGVPCSLAVALLYGTSTRSASNYCTCLLHWVNRKRTKKQ